MRNTLGRERQVLGRIKWYRRCVHPLAVERREDFRSGQYAGRSRCLVGYETNTSGAGGIPVALIVPSNDSGPIQLGILWRAKLCSAVRGIWREGEGSRTPKTCRQFASLLSHRETLFPVPVDHAGANVQEVVHGPAVLRRVFSEVGDGQKVQPCPFTSVDGPRVAAHSGAACIVTVTSYPRRTTPRRFPNRL